MSQFTTPLIVSPLEDGRRWQLVEGFEYHVGDYPSTDVITVPAGTITDFASVPQPLWGILPPWGKYGKAAVVHDWLYRQKSRSRKDADAVFLEAMAVLGVPRWQRRLMWLGVRVFGSRF